ncbi:hypothetical protein OIDMADRAFT_182912 [Oidiodendron maius Zn]|uniref:Peptidase S53 domain-containing protein n=1 Tax=Oidiodendron maius (strain Zn) TaxID=913774 RepID=A0A0C3H2I1_OIDMZ|nr:hypothetical protein OIDMADRAFT_182912 [Oidiodendron maius Zn]
MLQIKQRYNVYDKRAEQTGGRNTPNPTRISKIYGSFCLAISQYPAKCPYLPTVGATQLLPGLEEVGANFNGFIPAGGFFRNYSRPINGRGFPDVRAVGWDILDVYGPNSTLAAAAGTSASAPIFAAIFNHINEERLVAGKSTVGFVNPQIFNDVTEGNTSVCNSVAFQAAEGWDPMTGLGTPNYPKILDVFVKLP